MFAAFDPQGQSVAYVRENNLYVEDVATGTITAADEGWLGHAASTAPSTGSTRKSSRSATASAGAPTASRSPTGRSTPRACRSTRCSTPPPGSIPKVVPVRYPRTGQKNPAARVGVVPASGGETRWLEIAGDPRQNYIVRMDWVPESHELVVQQLNRRQDRLEVMLAEAGTGEVRTVLTDRDEAWVDVHDDLKWLDHGRAFTWTADRDGWRRLEVVRPRGEGPPRRLTRGDFDVISVAGVDEKGGLRLLHGLAREPDAELPLPGSARWIGQGNARDARSISRGRTPINSLRAGGGPSTPSPRSAGRRSPSW